MEAIWDSDGPPLFFRYGKATSDDLFEKWERKELQKQDAFGLARQIVFTDPAGSLRVTVHLLSFEGTSAYDWMIEFENIGATVTPIISHIMPLCLCLPVAPDDKMYLHHARGSSCAPDDFLPITEEIRQNQSVRKSPVGGRSSNGELPFMNAQLAEGGFVLAIGWSGQWIAEFDRRSDALCVKAGMERTHLRLHPGEKIRTPRILLIPWQGEDPVTGNNLLRRLLISHYVPRINGEAILPPVSHNTMYSYYSTGKVSEAREKSAILRSSELGIEAYWLDACWYGSGGEWWQEVGNWTVRKKEFPNGLRSLGDAAHREGLKFVLWFEPERVRNGTPVERDHPEFLLRSEHDPDNNLFNLGIPEARDYMTGIISGIISESGVDVFRQDFNFDPLPYWKNSDTEDRIGITEIRHIEGLYAMWDELRKRHQGLIIDNCASGGRRIDLETVSRSFPLWRSDFSDVGGPTHGRTLQIADQIQTAGLSRWVPLHTGPVWTFTTYDFRSALASGIVPYCDISSEDFPADEARRSFEELKSLRPYFVGDFYPLLPLTTASHDWCAYQYDRPDLGSGFAIFLRRHLSPFPKMEANLQHIAPEAYYDMSLAYDFKILPSTRLYGKDLMEATIDIPEAPGSVLLRYSRIET